MKLTLPHLDFCLIPLNHKLAVLFSCEAIFPNLLGHFGYQVLCFIPQQTIHKISALVFDLGNMTNTLVNLFGTDNEIKVVILE